MSIPAEVGAPTDLSALPDLSDLSSLPPSPRMPVLFVGHGSPMNTIEDNEFRRSWEALGAEFGTRWPRPALVLCISAHWLTHGWWITGQAQPRTIHDFGGFPQELFAQQYPAPGAPEVARQISQRLRDPAVSVDEHEWGFDHGSWSILKPMFPAAGIPTVQLSLNWDAPPPEHLAMGRRLRGLRGRGVLIVASGNTVHNLRTMRRDAPPDQAYDWTIAFDQQVGQWIAQGEHDALAGFQQLGDVAKLAQPSYDHFLPLLYAAGASWPGEPVRFFNERYQGASIAMRSAIWG